MPSSTALCTGNNLSAAESAYLNFRQENPLTCANWNARLSNQSQCTFFHSAEWASVLAHTYGFIPVYFTATRGEQLLSLLPLMEVDSWLTGRRGISLPWTDECQPLGFDASSFQEFFQKAITWGHVRHWKYLELRGGKMFLPHAPVSHSFFSHELKLTDDESHLFARLDSAVRRAIRKAEKQNVTAEISQDLDAVRVFYSLHCQTRKRHGLPPQPFSFFQNIHEHILSRNLGVLVSARYQHQVIAANVYFHLGSHAIYKYGASNEAFQDLRGNNLVMWEAIKWYARNGFKTLHFGRTSAANDGLRRFKLAWGVREARIEYVTYDLRKSAFVKGEDRAVGWYNRVFERLPVSLARIFGAVLYRHAA